MKCPQCGSILDEENGNRCSRFPICLYQDAQTISDFDEYIMYDLETTGLSNRDKIIEIGAIYVKDGKIVDKFSELCNPGRLITQKISDITGITNEMLKDKDYTNYVIRKFNAWIKSKGVGLCIGHNICSFDNRMLTNACKQIGEKFPFDASLDTYVLAKKMKLQERGLVTNNKQPTLASYYGIEYEAHRAVNDVEALQEIFIRLRKDAESLKIDLPIRFEK